MITHYRCRLCDVEEFVEHKEDLGLFHLLQVILEEHCSKPHACDGSGAHIYILHTSQHAEDGPPKLDVVDLDARRKKPNEQLVGAVREILAEVRSGEIIGGVFMGLHWDAKKTSRMVCGPLYPREMAWFGLQIIFSALREYEAEIEPYGPVEVDGDETEHEEEDP